MEILDLYDGNRVKTGKTMVRGTPCPKGYYRLVIHVCVFNGEGKMLIQRRQPFKKGWSNLWDVTVGGCAVFGDTSQSAAERELKEEIGLSHSFEGLRPSLTINFSFGFDDVYIIEKEVDLSSLFLQKEEVQSVKWADLDEILEKIRTREFITYDENFIRLVFSIRNQDGLHAEKDFTTPTER